MSRRTVTACLALLFLSHEAAALGVGDVVSQSRLGERLRIEIGLVAGADEGLESNCFKLSPGDNGDDLPWVRGARLRVQRGSPPSLIVESNEVVNHPLYMLGLRLACGAEVRREFTLMPQAPIQLPIAAGIAQAAHANPQLSEAVGDPSTHALPDGATLVVPGPPAGRTRMPQLAREHKPRLAAVARDDGDLVAKPRAARQPRVPHGEDRLTVTAPGAGEDGLKFSTRLDVGRSRGLSDEQRERLRQEQRLIAELDEKLVASLAVADKIRNIESYLEKLQGDMAQLDRKMQAVKNGAAAQTADSSPAATPATAPTVPTSPAPGNTAPPTVHRTEVQVEPSMWLYGLLGGGAIGLLGWFWLQQRRKALHPEQHEVDLEIRHESEPVAQADATEGYDTQTLAQPSRTAAAEPLSLPADMMPPLCAAANNDDVQVGIAEHDSALELAEIMLSFGRVQGAAQTLADYIEANPRQAVMPWLKLLEIYHAADMRAEFDTLMQKMHQNFNVEPVAWNAYRDALVRHSLEQMPRLIEPVVAHWGHQVCLNILLNSLHDNRDGTRVGFPLGVVDDIGTLIGLLEVRVGMLEAA